MKVLACLLNWRTADMTAGALDLLIPQLRELGSARVMVVDNDSQDGSFDRLATHVAARGYGDVAEVVASGRNGGFGFGNNVALRSGLRAADPPEYFYLLNSDAFMRKGALRALVGYADAHPRVGVAGSTVLTLEGVPQTSAFRFPSALSELERMVSTRPVSWALKRSIVPLPIPKATTTDVDWVAGASMLLRRDMLEQIGLFDEAFFLYYEETDLCLRAKRAGWQVAYVREGEVEHEGGASTGVTSSFVVAKPMPTYLFASRRHYFLKNHGRATLWRANAAHLVGGAVYRLRTRLGRRDDQRPREWLDGVIYNLRNP
ncbi:MAG: glycosyltransferase [Deltaproteobacteria bacterium]|nr:glycosyltransferase [Deltaproteobacteria bacterium]